MKKASISFAAFLGVAVLLLALLGLVASPVSAQQDVAPLSSDEASAIATEAYIYGYPLVTMEYTRRVLTNHAEPVAFGAPMGQLVRVRTYADATLHAVTAPNADTLYTTGWIDVSREPWVLSLPDAHGGTI